MAGSVWTSRAQLCAPHHRSPKGRRAHKQTFGQRSKLVDRIQHLIPASDGGDDPIRIGGPGFGVGVLSRDEAVDGALEVDERVEGSPFQAAAVGWRDFERDTGAHAPSFACRPASGNPPGTRPLGSIH